MTIYDWPFGTLPFGLFWSNLDTRDLQTYPRTYIYIPSLYVCRVGGGWGVPPTHVHMHTHAYTYMHSKYDNYMQMATPIGAIPRNSPWCHTCMCMHACMYVCMCVGGTPHHSPPTSTHPPTPQRGTPRISQNSIALELIEIFQFCLKIWNLWTLPHPSVGV